MTDNTADNGSRSRPELPLAAAARQLAAEKRAAAPTSPRRPAPRSGPGAVRPAPAGDFHPQRAAAEPDPPVTATATSSTAPAPPYAQYPPPAGPAAASPAQQPLMDPSYSPWWKRVCAALLDGAILSIPSGIIFALLGRDAVQTDPATGLATFRFTGAYATACILAAVAALAYYAVLEGGSRGASVGKMALGLSVRDASTLGPIGYGRALVRRLAANVLWWLLFLPGLLDVLWPLWDSRRQTLHDKLTRSVVVDKA
ncbi:MAG: RDD family protein [Acidimicrobiales bacterium]